MGNLFDKGFFRSRITEQDVKLKEMALGYLLAPFCAMIANSIFGSYLNRYYVDVLGWTRFGVFATLLPMISVIFVIAGNLLVGQWIDRTRTKAGKARPYLMISIPLIAVAILLMFMTPTNGSNAVQMIWIAVSYNLYYSVAYPCYYTAHSSMVSLSTRDTDKRGLLATLSNASMVAAAGIGASIVVPILLQPFMFVTGADGSIDMASSYANWRMLSIILALVTAFGVILEFCFTRERITEETMGEASEDAEVIPMKRHIEVCTKEKYWWMVILFVFFFQMGQLCKNSSMSFYARWMFDSVINSANPEGASGTLMSTLGLVGGLPSALGMFIAWPLASRLGKKRSIVIGLIFALIGGLVAFINVNNFLVVSIGVVLKGIGIIPAQYVMLAVISDVLDHLEASHGFRSDGFTMSIYGAIMVGLSGLSIGIINAMLTYSGYTNTGIPADPVAKMPIEDLASWTGQVVYRQMGGTEQVLAFVYLGMDMITFLVSIILLWRMDVEKYAAEDQAKLGGAK
ncbi:MAG: MFS transporter [Lachnospiraceae bacterium]|nr:MFS transporter [Lachnospiraceae bacterium]